MRGERRDHDTLFGRPDDAAQRHADFGFGLGELPARGIGRIAHEQVDTLRGEACEGGEVCELAVDGCLVELEIAGVQNVSGRRVHEDAHGARNRVVDREELELEAAELGVAATMHLDELGLLREAMLLELSLDETQG